MSFKMDREEYAQHYGPTVGDSVRLEIPIFLQPLKKTLLFMDRNLSSVAVKFCVMVWVLVLRKHVTIHQLLIPLLQVQPSLTIQVLLKQISVFVMVRLLLLVAVVTQIQWTMWTLLWVLVAEAIAAEGLIVTAGGIDLHVHYISAEPS